MKVALVKQAIDLFGPWQSFKWSDNPEGLLRIWNPYKVSVWEMTCVLKADWYIIPQELETDYIRRARLWFPNVMDVLEKYTKGIMPPEEIPWEKYDVIITFDPILNKNVNPVLAYYMTEHTDRLYRASLIRPLRSYDLFLAHLMDASDSLTTLPQSITFPYLRDPKVTRKIFDQEKEDRLWLDYRMIELANQKWKLGRRTPLNLYICVQMRKLLRDLYKENIRINSKKPVGLNPSKTEDGKTYLNSLSRCKYYLGFMHGRNKVGQTVADAASLGCICFGEKGVKYHELICHPICILSDQGSFHDRFNAVRKSTSLQEEIKKWQDNALHEFFLKRPLDMLEKACIIKKEIKLLPLQRKTLNQEQIVQLDYKDIIAKGKSITRDAIQFLKNRVGLNKE
jgi:hypothetical protein